MTEPVLYGEHSPLAPGTACLLCGSTNGTTVVDHCHTHGWVRGPLCSSHNAIMAFVDRRIEPSDNALSSAPLDALLEHVSRCHECPKLTPADMADKALFYDTGTVRKTQFVKIDLTVSARDKVRAATAAAGAIGRKVSMSDYLIAMLAVAEEHRDEVLARLKEAA